MTDPVITEQLFEALVAEVRRLSTVVSAQQARLDDLDRPRRIGARQDCGPATGPDHQEPDAPSDTPDPRGCTDVSRRRLLGLATAGAVGAAGSLVAAATPVAAANGDNLVLGTANESTAGTTWSKPTSSASDDFVLGLRVPNTSTSGGLDISIEGPGSGIEVAINKTISVEPALRTLTLGTGSAIEAAIDNSSQGKAAVEGTTNGVGFGLRGLSTAPGSTGGGVLAESFGTNTALLADHNGTAGTAVFGRARSGTTTAVALRGEQSGLGAGALIETTNAGNDQPGLRVMTAGSGAGIEVATAAGPGMSAASAGGIGVVASGASAQLRLVPPSPPRVGAPTSGTHLVGEIFLDSDSAVFVCVNGGTPGTWALLGTGGGGGGGDGGGPAPDPAGHRLTLLATPQRAFDSRAGRVPTGAGPGTKGPLRGSDNTRTIDLRSAGGVPDDAAAALVNVTVTETTNAGYVSIYSAALKRRPDTSTINWASSNTNIANTTVVATDRGRIRAFAANATHLIIDVLGYYI